MGSAADLLNVARSYLGVREDPPHSNLTIIGERFGWNGVAWCAEDCSVCLAEAGVPFNGSASCSVLVGRYQSGENGTWLGNPGPDGIRPGDEGFLGAGGGDHTFFVEAIDGDTAHCLDGNWGDADVRVDRPVSSIHGFGRPNYDDAAAPDLPPPSATQGRAIVRLGSTGTGVSDVQTFLNAFHGAGLTVDGDFGPSTDASVRSYQQSRGLVVDGVVGPGTYADIDGVLAYCAGAAQTAEPVDSIPAFPGTCRLGSRGDAVTAVQQRLVDRNWTITVDGVFGRGTDSIVRQFQTQKGLTVDGIAGPGTWVALWTLAIT